MYAILHSYNNSAFAKAGMALLVEDTVKAITAVRRRNAHRCTRVCAAQSRSECAGDRGRGGPQVPAVLWPRHGPNHSVLGRVRRVGRRVAHVRLHDHAGAASAYLQLQQVRRAHDVQRWRHQGAVSSLMALLLFCLTVTVVVSVTVLLLCGFLSCCSFPIAPTARVFVTGTPSCRSPTASSRTASRARLGPSLLPATAAERPVCALARFCACTACWRPAFACASGSRGWHPHRLLQFWSAGRQPRV